MMHWYTPHLCQPIRAHAMEGRQGVTAVCGEHMSIYRRADSDQEYGRDERCADCMAYLQNYSVHQARARGHYVRDGETESSIVTRMVVEGWMGSPHYGERCKCMPVLTMCGNPS